MVAMEFLILMILDFFLSIAGYYIAGYTLLQSSYDRLMEKCPLMLIQIETQVFRT